MGWSRETHTRYIGWSAELSAIMELLTSIRTFQEAKLGARGMFLSEYRVLSIRVIDITRQGSFPI
jgi:hypothetical protein